MKSLQRIHINPQNSILLIVDMENELSQLLGRKVDLRTPKDLSRYFREQVIREAEVRYAAT